MSENPNQPITTCKRNSPAAGATQGYIRLHAAVSVHAYNDMTGVDRKVALDKNEKRSLRIYGWCKTAEN